MDKCCGTGTCKSKPKKKWPDIVGSIFMAIILPLIGTGFAIAVMMASYNDGWNSAVRINNYKWEQFITDHPEGVEAVRTRVLLERKVEELRRAQSGKNDE